MGINLINKYQNLVISKSGKKVMKNLRLKLNTLNICVVKFEVENFKHLCENCEHLHSKV